MMIPCWKSRYTRTGRHAMRMLAPAVLLLFTLSSAPAATTYKVTRWTGDHDFLNSFRGSSHLVFGPGQNDTLSDWQTLPFSWQFFGQDVEGYFVSDNGYITFDRQARGSIPTNTVIPHDGAPANSIFAFWSDLRLDMQKSQWDNRVWTATLGTAPRRVHLIYWLSVAAERDPEGRYYFALALYENGSFEVIMTSAVRGATIRGTVGALSADGTTAVTAAGPGFDYPNVGFGGDDDVNFLFRPVER
jgi:hypothetical protein